MKLSELISSVGDDKVSIQNLDECAVSLDYNAKHGSTIKFGTTEPISVDGTSRLGIVVWLPRDAVKAALSKAVSI